MRGGGVETAAVAYYKYLDRNKIQCDFFLDEDSSDNPATRALCNEIESLGGKIIKIPKYQKQFAYQKVLYEIFTRNKYPLVFSHINSLSVFPLFAAWRAGVPVRVALSQSTSGKGEFIRNVIKNALRPFSKTFATHLCACSKFAGEWLFGKKAMNSGKVIVWPNAIELERFAYNENTRNEARKFLKLENKFVVGHVGRFMRQKNHSFLIDVFAEISRRRDDAVLLLAGDGPLMDEITEKVLRLGLNDRVIFLGSVNDPEKYYQAMDVFILPSLYEGLPVVGSEVQVSGLPFLCSDRVTPEVKFCDAVKFLSLKTSPAEWADEALKISSNHLRRDMSMSARENGFDIKEQAAKLSQWYCEILGV